MKKRISRRNFLRTTAASGAAFAGAASPLRLFAQDEELDLPEGVSGTLSVIHRTEYFEEVQNLFRDTVQGFADEKGIGLDISTANSESFGDFMSKMQAAVAAGNPPDIAYSTNISIAQMHLLDLLEDVSDVVEEAEKRYGRIMPGTNAPKNAQFDGVWKAIPFLATTSGWWARRDMVEAAGYDVLTDMETYDQRREVALAMSDPDNEFWGWGITPNQSGDGYGFLSGAINAFGGSYTDETGLKVIFDSPETLAAVEWLTELYTGEMYAPALPPGILSWGDISNNEAYLAGTIGLTVNAFSVYAQAKRDDLPVYPNTAFLKAPLGPSGIRQDAGANSWLTIFKGSPNVDAAKELALHLMDPANFTPMAEAGGGLFLPAYEDLWTEDLLAIDPNFATIKDLVSIEEPYIGHSWPAEPNAAIDALRANSVPEQMMANVTSGRMTPAEAVTEAHKQIVDIFEEGGIMQ
jgi:multiple sugar transport system substrate-binding protein